MSTPQQSSDHHGDADDSQRRDDVLLEATDNPVLKLRPRGAHKWPVNDECLFSEWKTLRGLPMATQYRNCLHPECNNVEHRDAPKG